MAGGYDVSSYSPGDGHQSFDASGVVAETPAAAPAAPAPAASPAPVAPAAPAPAAEVKEGVKETIEPEIAEQAEVREPSDVPVVLSIPDFVSSKERTLEREQHVQQFAQLAPGSGLDGETAQGLVEMVTDAATLLPYQIEHSNVTADEARAEMSSLFGEKQGRELVVAAQAYFKTLAPEMQSYLDESGLGSDPSVLASMALAKGGWLKMTPVAAAATVKRLMGTKEWASGDRLTQLKIHVASRIAERGEGAAQPAPGAGPRTLQEHQAKQHEVNVTALKDEAAALIGKKGGMSPHDRERFIEITRRISQ